MVKTGLVLLSFVVSSLASASDLDLIFTSNSKVTPEGQKFVTDFVKENCKDLNWALAVDEIKPLYEVCPGNIEKVHLNVELSHKAGEMIFWLKRDDKGRVQLDWIYEENLAWRLCSFSDAYERWERTCENRAFKR